MTTVDASGPSSVKRNYQSTIRTTTTTLHVPPQQQYKHSNERRRRVQHKNNRVKMCEQNTLNTKPPQKEEKKTTTNSCIVRTIATCVLRSNTDDGSRRWGFFSNQIDSVTSVATHGNGFGKSTKWPLCHGLLIHPGWSNKHKISAGCHCNFIPGDSFSLPCVAHGVYPDCLWFF